MLRLKLNHVIKSAKDAFSTNSELVGTVDDALAPWVAINTNDIDYVESVSSCFTCGRTSTVCAGVLYIVNTYLCFF